MMPNETRAAANAGDMAASFNALVESGVYSRGHVHGETFRRLFATGLLEALSRIEVATPRILEVGCGAGAWIAEMRTVLTKAGRQAELYGTDIAPRMVETCRARFAGEIPSDRFQAGDILAVSAYGDADSRYDLIVAYDVVQQLPRAAQFASYGAMARHLSPGGALLIFDNEADSPYGRRMARKKFLTRYFGLRLVPRYYCDARYPPLSDHARRLTREGLTTRLVQMNGLHKSYLIAQPKPA